MWKDIIVRYMFIIFVVWRIKWTIMDKINISRKPERQCISCSVEKSMQSLYKNNLPKWYKIVWNIVLYYLQCSMKFEMKYKPLFCIYQYILHESPVIRKNSENWRSRISQNGRPLGLSFSMLEKWLYDVNAQFTRGTIDLFNRRHCSALKVVFAEYQLKNRNRKLNAQFTIIIISTPAKGRKKTTSKTCQNAIYGRVHTTMWCHLRL